MSGRGAVHFGTDPTRTNPYSGRVQLTSVTTIFTTLWVLMVAALGIIGQARSLVSWMFLAGLGALPIVFTLFWVNGPVERLSQIIQKARR
jgi:hypothetical protein